MSSYKTSDGNYITKKTIDYRVQKAKDEYTEAVCSSLHIDPNHIMCERCRLPNSVAPGVSRSHIVSVKYCQDNGMSEIAYCHFNFEHLCLNDHREWEDKPNEIRYEFYLYRKEKIIQGILPTFKEFMEEKNN